MNPSAPEITGMLRYDDERRSMDVREIGAVLRRRKWSVIVVTLVTVAIAMYLVERRTPVYSSTASVEVRPMTTEAALAGYYYDPGMDTEATRVTSSQVSQAARQLLTENGQDPALLAAASLAVSVPTNTTYIEITCTSREPETARLCADAYSRAYVDDRIASAQADFNVAQKALNEEIRAAEAEIEQIDQELRSRPGPLVRVNLEADRAAQEQIRDNARLKLLNLPTPSAQPALVSEQAELPLQPSNKDYVEIGILAAILGVALGTGLAFLRHRLDDRVAEHLGLEHALGAPVLAAVPHLAGFRSKKHLIASITDPTGPSAEAYRSARTTLLYLANEHDLKVLLVTSPGPGDGKTTTAANLGVALARSDKRVILVSADLRKPRLAWLFGAEPRTGLTDVLRGRVALQDAVIRTEIKNLLILPSGPVPEEPAELLASKGMEHVVALLRDAADIVLIDSAPTLLVADSLELVPLADGVVVVADASSSTRAAVEQLRTQVERIGGSIVGCILNNLDPSATAYSAYYGRRYGYRDRGSTRRRKRRPQVEEMTPERPLLSSDSDDHDLLLPTPNVRSRNGNGHHPASEITSASPGRRSRST